MEDLFEEMQKVGHKQAGQSVQTADRVYGRSGTDFNEIGLRKMCNYLKCCDLWKVHLGVRDLENSVIGGRGDIIIPGEVDIWVNEWIGTVEVHFGQSYLYYFTISGRITDRGLKLSRKTWKITGWWSQYARRETKCHHKTDQKTHQKEAAGLHP